MKIGIITFHWVTNYGAVLQSYALQKYLSNKGHNVEIINYYPKEMKQSIIDCLFSRNLNYAKEKTKKVIKEFKLEKFRENHINESKYYSTHIELKEDYPDYDCYICGSDQIWNDSFIEQRHKTSVDNLVYYLDFAPEDRIITSYAASIGRGDFSEENKSKIKKCLDRFDKISVRESSAVEVLNRMGYDDVSLVPDPTLLLNKEEYIKLIPNISNDEEYCYVYMLHNRIEDAKDIINKINCKKRMNRVEGIEKWLENIYNSKIVVTNSFHGVVFSILFNKPFVAILIGASAMNDRMTTLLDKLGLQDRIYNGNCDILNKDIDWETVGKKLGEFRESGYGYIEEMLGRE